MTNISVSHIEQCLREVLAGDDTIVVFSRIWTFAHRVASDPQQLPATLVGLLERLVGPDRTLVFPAFTFSYGRTREYDSVRSKPETGKLPEFALAGGYARTPSPMINWLVKGPREHEILAQAQVTGWGEDSVIAWLARERAQAIGLGIVEANFGWSIVHRAEEVASVPYRYYKRILGQRFHDGTPVGACQEVLFVQPLTISLTHDHRGVTERLVEQGQLHAGGDRRFPVLATNCGDVLEASLDLLEQDSLAFMADRDAVARWVGGAREAEIGGLALDERWPPD